MKLQRIIAKDSRTANEQAIAQYGRDVLVVSNSRVNGMTELIVAVDIEPEATPRPTLRPGAAQAFEATLQNHLKGGAQRMDAESGSAAAPAAREARENREGGESTEGFVPAHLALMRSAQRAAAAIDPTAAAGPASTASPASPANGDAGAKPTLRYGAQFSLGGFGGNAPTTVSFHGPIGAGGTAAAPTATATATAQAARALGNGAMAHAQDRHSPEADDPPRAQDLSALPLPSAEDARSAVDLIRRELADLRREMRMSQQLQAWSAQGPAHRRNEALAEVGAPTTLRALLVSGLSNDLDDAQALEAIEAQMIENLPTPPRRPGRGAAQTLPWRSGVHLLSGPSGAGKTSMAARLAQEAAQRLGVQQVVLVGWNDTRPGAWGQLQLWASRIGVAAYRAADTATLDMLLQEHRGRLVIVDNGLSQPDILAAACANLAVAHHLVMPADATPATLRRWIGEQTPAWQDLMVTRLDESSQPWALLQACCEHRLMPVAGSDGSGIQHLRLPYDAQALLQHSIGLLAAVMGAQPGGDAQQSARSLEIPTIEHITTTVPTRQAGRSGRSASRGTSTPHAGRTGAPHA